MRFEPAQAVADAVLLEGYVLYPYRATAPKNRYRWTFGVLAPRAWSEAGGCEPWWLEAQFLVEDAPCSLSARLRFLQVEARSVEIEKDGSFEACEALEVDGRCIVPWEEGLVREIDLLCPAEPTSEGIVRSFTVPAERTVEPLTADRGARARIVRERRGLCGVVSVTAKRAGPRLSRYRIRVENLSPCQDSAWPRASAVRSSLVSTHLCLSLEGGRFLSLLDPPEHARAAAAACRSVGVYPVLVGDAGRSDLLLCSPLIMHDHPRIAPESPGDFFDATEIDELLSLRTLTLTTEEKKLARATDPRAAKIVDRVEAMSPQQMARLHGAIRDKPHPFRPGARVRLKPGVRRTDAQDLLFAGRVATIEEIREDVDGRVCLAVTIDDDPAAELHRWYGRYHYYHLDEVELLREPSP